MTIEVKHKFQSAKADSGDASLIRPSNWNDTHDITLAGQRLLGRHASGAGAAQEITVGAGLEFSAGALKADEAVLLKVDGSNIGDDTAKAVFREAIGVASGGNVGDVVLVYGNGTTVKPGHLLMNGFSVTSAYPELRSFGLANGWQIDGNGDPICPDMGGYFARGWRPGQLVDSGRVFGTVQADQMQGWQLGATSDLTGARTLYGFAGERDSTAGGTTAVDYSHTRLATSGQGLPQKLVALSDGVNGAPRVGSENRPANVTFTYWIKAYEADQVPGSVEFGELANDVLANQVAISNLKTQFLHVRDQKAVGVSGGNSINGVQQRALNTVVLNGIVGASLSSNVITLPAGTYDVEIRCPVFLAGNNKAWLRVAGGGATLLEGSSGYSATTNGDCVSSIIRGRLILEAPTAMEVVQYTSTVVATSGLGAASNQTGHPEIYTEAMFWKVG